MGSGYWIGLENIQNQGLGLFNFAPDQTQNNTSSAFVLDLIISGVLLGLLNIIQTQI